jgi:hypothetical protein
LSKNFDAIEAHTVRIVISDPYSGLDQVAAAHQDLDSTHGVGKRVVVIPAQ